MAPEVNQNLLNTELHENVYARLLLQKVFKIKNT